MISTSSSNISMHTIIIFLVHPKIWMKKFLFEIENVNVSSVILDRRVDVEQHINKKVYIFDV